MFLVYQHINNTTVFVILKKDQKEFEKKLKQWKYNEEDFEIEEVNDTCVQISSAGFSVR